MDSSNFTSLYSAGCQQKNGCTETQTGSLLLSSLLDPSRPRRNLRVGRFSRLRVGLCRCQLHTSFPAGSENRTLAMSHFPPIVDSLHLHTYFGGAWCSQESHLSCTPLAPRRFCYTISICVSMGSSFFRIMCPPQGRHIAILRAACSTQMISTLWPLEVCV
jgi:hypothetical protein